jgi:dUTP pyrophosphatase
MRIQRVGTVEVPLPSYQTPGSAGLDLHAALQEPLTLAPGARQLVPTGLALAIPLGYEGQVRPRSGLALKHGLSLVNTPGTIDSDYRGEVAVIVINHGTEPVTIRPLDRVAQLVIARVERAELQCVAALDATERGAGGYGSTGR